MKTFINVNVDCCIKEDEPKKHFLGGKMEVYFEDGMLVLEDHRCPPAETDISLEQFEALCEFVKNNDGFKR